MMLSVKKHCKTKSYPPPTGALRLEHHVVQQKFSVKPVSYYNSLQRTTFVMVKQGGRLDHALCWALQAPPGASRPLQRSRAEKRWPARDGPSPERARPTPRPPCRH